MKNTEDEVLILDQYETEDGARWNWKKGRCGSQEFESEQAALEAFANGSIMFSTVDDESV